MAQLVERLVRNEKASGSNPLISTKKIRRNSRLIFLSIIVRTAEVSALTLASSLFRRDAPYVQRHTYNHLQPLFYLPALNLMKKTHFCAIK